MPTKDEKEIIVAVTCVTCKKIILTNDRRRRYCDTDREYCGGEWRQKHYIKRFYKEKQKKYNMRQTRITGTGFSEHLITDKKTGEAIFQKERIAVRKERKRIGI